MPNVTKNYGLTKPLPEEFYDIHVQNNNMDIIDENLKKLADSTPDVSSQINTHNVDGNAHQDIRNAINTHTANKNNPHGLTAEQIGARPNTWMPTAEDVGAIPNSGNVTHEGDFTLKGNFARLILEDTQASSKYKGRIYQSGNNVKIENINKSNLYRSTTLNICSDDAEELMTLNHWTGVSDGVAYSVLHSGNSNKTRLVSTDTTPTVNNEINWIYK